jgi:5,6-dimethylbenzimidazole synthase
MRPANGSGFSAAERAAVYRAIGSRRDVRADFIGDTVPDDVLDRVLAAANLAPSVGLSQPWRFIVVRDLASRTRVRAAFEAANATASAAYTGEELERYARLTLQGILEAPVNICVVCDDDPQRGHGLGRQTMPETARYSTVCAIQNLWLAARVEGLGVGWVSIIDPRELREIFDIPERLTIVAYLCVGYVRDFADEPDLLRAGWETVLPLSEVVDQERYTER